MHGVWFQDGRHLMANATSSGLRPLALSSSSMHLSVPMTQVPTIDSMETTRVLLRDGGTVGVATQLSTMSSVDFTSSLKNPVSVAPYTHHMSPVHLTLPMAPPRVNSHQNTSCHLLTSPLVSTVSSLMPPPPIPPPNSDSIGRVDIHEQLHDSLTILSRILMPGNVSMRSTSERNILSSTSTGKVNGVPRFGAPLPSPISQGHPRPYQPGLTPLPSPWHPHCLARDCLLLWLPVSTRK